ncbi:MAG: hypothetical protein BEU01_00735 [Marine Group III euryarchaeote CG-Epi4]|uniref:CARDB domain-containing protein n=1 Tax=Marine Group III euryarchaeote CG-Epi4 TaxID=1888998 RepID=A0A1J5TWC5_9ARCH|nr:MAG: hypothetical protein BEU01_00735 [Marine Group III euryarchaeote CG-Epi4]
MVDSRMSKVFVTSVAALLLLSSVVFLAGSQADASDDLQITDAYAPDGTPPPRQNIEYDYLINWRNVGDSDYTGKVVLYAPASNGDCSFSSVADETNDFNMESDQNGQVTLSITFDQVGDVCITAAIVNDGNNYGEYQVIITVEPETGDADLYASFDMESNEAAAQEPVTITFEFGNQGDVSTQTPISLMVWFGDDDNNEEYVVDPSPATFDFISPDPDDEGIPPARLDWEYTLPDIEDGLYKLKVKIDSDGNNTEDSDTSNNVDIIDLCVGDCSQADLKVKDRGPDTLVSLPEEPVAGRIVTFSYSIENIGQGEARGTPSNPLVMFLEVMKCPNKDCSDQTWVKVNESREIRPGIPANGGEFNDDFFLRMNWSTSPQDAGFWNVRVFVDGYDSINELNETNNANSDADWYKVKSDYLELREQRPDLIVANIDEGNEKVYNNEENTLLIAVSQADLGDSLASNVKVYLRIVDPFNDPIEWFEIDEPKTVGFDGLPTFFEHVWTPTKVGTYGISAHVDRNDEILEWSEDNNQLSNIPVTVYEKLPDLEIAAISVSPVSDGGYAMVGVNSEITATITNSGVRNMTDSEGTKLEVSFYTVSPFNSKLAAINVDKALAMGETTDVTIPFTFFENAAYRFIVKVDENQEISEGPGGPELNNEGAKNVYAESSVDAFVSNMTVDLGDGLAGKECPMVFEVGIANIPQGATYRLHFNVSVDGTFGWGEVLSLANQNSTGFYPVGTGYSVSGQYAFIDFNSSYSSQTVEVPWFPSKERTDKYNASVSVSSSINVNDENDIAYVNQLSITKLTTNLAVEAFKVTENDGSAELRVTIGYPQGEQSELDVEIAMHVYKASDYADGNPPIDTLTVKTIEGLMRGDSKAISFTWAVKDGGYIFVAIIDPSDMIKEVEESDNIFPSKEQTFGASNVANLDDDEEDDGLLPAPSLLAILVIFSMVALIRRRN